MMRAGGSMATTRLMAMVAVRRVPKSAIMMTSQGQTCVNTPILDTLRLPCNLRRIPVNDLGDRHPLQYDRVVQRVVELVRLRYAGRREHVDRLRDRVRIRGAVRVAAHRRADAEQEVLRRRG